MNNAKLWLVVKPTVGIPLFLGAVAVTGFAVHIAVLINTDFVDGYYTSATDSTETSMIIEDLSPTPVG